MYFWFCPFNVAAAKGNFIYFMSCWVACKFNQGIKSWVYLILSYDNRLNPNLFVNYIVYY